MGTNLCNEPGKKSVRMNEKDVERAEELDLDDVSASTVFSELLKKAVRLEEIKEEKRSEHREIRDRIKDEENLYGLD